MHPRSVIALAMTVMVVMVVLSGCSSDGHGYTKATETAFIAACAAQQREPAPICQCAYDEIVQKIPFDTYVEYDRQLRKDPNDVPPDILRIVADCGSRPGVSSSSSSS